MWLCSQDVYPHKNKRVLEKHMMVYNAIAEHFKCVYRAVAPAEQLQRLTRGRLILEQRHKPIHVKTKLHV